MNNDAVKHPAVPVRRGINPDIVSIERKSLEHHSKFRAAQWATILLSLILTFGVWQYARNQVALRAEVRFAYEAHQIADLIQERLQKYELALWAGVAAVKTQEDGVDLDEWQVFAEILDIENRYPGINGIGIIHEVQPDELAGYLAQQRRLRPDFAIYPPHEGKVYQPITFISPVETNAEAVGLDMVHEGNRHSSFNKAKDTGLAQMTGPIVLVQDKEKTPGFLLFAPFYDGMIQGSDEARKGAFVGAVYAPFVVSNLMSGVLNQDGRSTAIRITDGEQVIYNEISEDADDYDLHSLGERQIVIPAYGREWTLDVRAGLNFRAENLGFEGNALLVIGLLLDGALVALFIMLTGANRRGLRFADMATDALNAESAALQNTVVELEAARHEAESASRMKSNFLSTMSHEVRTPLTAISGILVLLERAKLPQKQDRLVQAGKTASEKLLKLLTDVLETTRIEADGVQLWEREVELVPLVEEYRTLAEGMVEKLGKGISVVTQISDCTPKKLLIDDIRLSQVLNNLMDNAIRFTVQGTITISTSCEGGLDGQPPWAIISLSDTGIGIAEEDLAVIFDRFRQVDGSMTRARDGTGLGLSISSDLVRLMGGELTVSSQLGKGTVFKMRLPVRALSEGKSDNA